MIFALFTWQDEVLRLDNELIGGALILHLDNDHPLLGRQA